MPLFSAIAFFAIATMARADIPGACCLSDGTCAAYVNSVACESDGGTFAGFGITCDNADCAAVPTDCDRPLMLSDCPQLIIFETRDADGATFTMPNPPTATGCSVIVTMEPPLGALLPIGANQISVFASDDLGNLVTCQFVVVVDLVDEVGPIQKRRIKGGGAIDPALPGEGENSICDAVVPGAAWISQGPLCGTCQLAGLLGSLAGLCAGRRIHRRTGRRRAK